MVETVDTQPLHQGEYIVKVLHVSYTDSGGAGIAASRLNEALIAQGIASHMFVARKYGSSPQISTLTGIEYKYARLRASLMYRVVTKGLGYSLRSVSVLPSGLSKTIREFQPDILHLHWTNAEFLSVADLPRLNIPTVWTLHDMWAFCGAEHCATSTRYVEGYTKSNFDKDDAGRWPGLDLDRWTWNRKVKHWSSWSPALVTPSNWLADCARKSALFHHHEVEVVPNCLDLSVFKPTNQRHAREELHLPLDKKLLLFGAFNVEQPHKGMDLLIEALEKIPLAEKTKLECVVFGVEGEAFLGGIKTRWIGRLSDQEELALLYGAADLFACPSRIDNLPNTCVEAQACGTPVVAFNIGGLSDIVEHKKSGYLANPFDVSEFMHGLMWLLDMEAVERRGVQKDARSHIVEMCSPESVVQRYCAVYQRMIKEDS